MLSEWVKNLSLRRILWGAGIIRVLTAIFNPGYFAYDDYQSMLRILVPAQRWDVAHIIAESEIRSPVARLVLVPFTRLALALGAHDPLRQIQFLYAVLGLLSLFAIWALYKNIEESGYALEAKVAALLCSFHFILPYLNTRVMFENLCLIPMTMSVLYAGRAMRGNKIYLNVTAAVFLLTLAAVLRPQAGLCFVALAAAILWSRKIFLILTFAIASLVGFFASGFLEQYLRGSFHESLKIYYVYCRDHAVDYGVYPFYFFVPILIGLGYLVWLINRGMWPKLKAYGAANILLVWYFAFFFVGHSGSAHKEDRFIFPILFIYLALCAPLFAELLRRGQRVRLSFVVGINTVLLVGTSFFPAQWNVVGLVRTLDANAATSARIEKLYSFQESLGMFPAAYAESSLPEPVRVDDLMDPRLKLACGTGLVIRDDYVLAYREILRAKDLNEVATFRPGPLEALVVKLNPKKNRRRSALHLYGAKGC